MVFPVSKRLNRSAAFAGAKPLFISDFDGAVTKRDTNELLLRLANPSISMLRKAMLGKRTENIELLRPSGLLELAPEAGICVKRSGASYSVRRSPGWQVPMGTRIISPAAMPEQIAGRMERYYSRNGLSLSEFFSFLLPTDDALDAMFSGAADIMDVHDRQLSSMLRNETSRMQFHSFFDLVYTSFLVRRQVDAASKLIADELVRPGMANVISAVKKAGGHIIFCSYSYLQIMEGVLGDMMRRVGKKHSGNVHCVANSIRFGEDGLRDRIIGIDRIGDNNTACPERKLQAAGGI